MKMNEKFSLNQQMIYDKEFSIDFKGYSAEEVDAFLDIIIKDYKKTEEELQSYQNEIALLQQNNAALKSYIIELEAKLKFHESSTPTNASDILKRISRLEAMLDGSDKT